MKTKEFTLHTDHEGMYNVTVQVRHAIQESGVKSGMAKPFPTGANSAMRRGIRPRTSSPAVLGQASSC